MATTVPHLRQTVIDCENARALGDFYRDLLGLHYRPGDETPPPGGPAEDDWVVLWDDTDTPRLAFQQVAHLPRPTWPEGGHPQMMHLDLTVPTAADLEAQRTRALALGATQLYDRSDDDTEPLYVFADPSGHPFCIFVG